MAHYFLGHIHLAAERYEQALEEFRNTLRIYPRFMNAHISAASTLELQNKNKMALKAYRVALSFEPKNGIIRERIERLTKGSQVKDPSASKEELREWLRGANDALLVYRIIGRIYFERQQRHAALLKFRLFLHAHPEDAQLRRYVAIIQESRDRFEDSLRELRIVLKHRPRLVEVHFHISRVLMKLKREKEAIKHLYTKVFILFFF